MLSTETTVPATRMPCAWVSLDRLAFEVLMIAPTTIAIVAPPNTSSAIERLMGP
jgi:hypothetical protein